MSGLTAQCFVRANFAGGGLRTNGSQDLNCRRGPVGTRRVQSTSACRRALPWPADRGAEAFSAIVASQGSARRRYGSSRSAGPRPKRVGSSAQGARSHRQERQTGRRSAMLWSALDTDWMQLQERVEDDRSRCYTRLSRAGGDVAGAPVIHVRDRIRPSWSRRAPPMRKRRRTTESSACRMRAAPPNKGMKLTKPERNGALQLIPGVRRTVRERTTDRA